MISNFIQKVTLDFRFNSRQNGHEAIDKMREQFYDEMFPVIESVFEKNFSSETVRIEYLELDLGQVSADQLSGLLEAGLEKLITGSKYHLPLQLPNYKERVEQNITLPDEKEDQISVLFHFLKYGYLPWFPFKGGIDLPEIFYSVLLGKNSGYLNQLTQLLKSHDDAITRLINLLPEEGIKKFVEQLMTINSDADKAFIDKWIKHLLISYISVEDFDKAFLLNRTFKYLLNQTGPINKNNFLKFLFTQFRVKNNIGELTHENLNTFELFIKIVHLIATDLNKKAGDLENWPPAEMTDRPSGYLSPDKPVAEFPEQEPEYLSKEPGTEESDLDKSYQITNAGLILLHPFLPAFFEELNFMHHNKFANQKTQIRAVRLLHYLATGEQKTPEYLLTLNKVLCGLPLHFPIPGKIKITDAEKNACDQLLGAVIEHWKPMSGTSIPGFMSSFLQREGIIKKEENDWIVRIEKKSYDILLEELPWSYSVIKLPWNEYIIYAEW